MSGHVSSWILAWTAFDGVISVHIATLSGNTAGKEFQRTGARCGQADVKLRRSLDVNVGKANKNS